jgi:hypothetical protein
MRDRDFYENIAEQSGNSAFIEALTRVALQIQLCGTIASVSPEPSAQCMDATTSYKHSRPVILSAPPFSSAAASALRRKRFLRAFPMRQCLAKAGITSRLSESCYRMALTSPGSGNSAER